MEKLIFLISLILISTWPHEISSDNSQTCGRPLGETFQLVNDRIVSGYDVGYYRYPWYAALLFEGSVSCGGALIGPKTVLTAAHCYGDYMKRKTPVLETIYTVKLGVYNICTTEATAREFTVEKVHVHELYLDKQPYYDISVITLSESTADFMPICLPQRAIGRRPNEGTVPGLGTLRFKGAMPCTLHEARLLIYPDEVCRKMIEKTGNNASELVNAYCAGYLQGGIDTCQGDSGGPLQIMSDDGSYVVSGIVSFGFRCAMPGLLGVYTDVSAYLDWIYEKTGIKYTPPIAIQPPPQPLPHLRPYWKPIKVIIVHGNNVIVIRKRVLHRPIVK